MVLSASPLIVAQSEKNGPPQDPQERADAAAFPLGAGGGGMSGIWPFSIRDALRRELSWTRLPVGRTPILYAACRELPSVNKLGNCQGMLDSSGIKTLRMTRLARQ